MVPESPDLADVDTLVNAIVEHPETDAILEGVEDELAERADYHPDPNVNKMILEVLRTVDDHVTLSDLQNAVVAVGQYSQPATIKRYSRQVIEYGPFEPVPRQVSRWRVIHDSGDGDGE